MVTIEPFLAELQQILFTKSFLSPNAFHGLGVVSPNAFHGLGVVSPNAFHAVNC